MLKKTVAAFAVLLAFASLARAEERITNFQSAIHILKGGSLQITETIEVVSEGQAIKNGFYRDLPTVREMTAGMRSLSYSADGVMCDGEKSPFSSENNGDSFRIYIGDPEKEWAAGTHRCELSYVVGNTFGGAFEFMDDQDELTWDVTGYGWSFPIESTSAEIVLPRGAHVRQSLAYTGLKGAMGVDYISEPTPEGGLYFTAIKTFPPGEGMMVVVGLEKGGILEGFEDAPGGMTFTMGSDGSASVEGGTSLSRALMTVLGPAAFLLALFGGIIILYLSIVLVIFSLIFSAFLMLAAKIIIHYRPGYWRCLGVSVLSGIACIALAIGIGILMAIAGVPAGPVSGLVQLVASFLLSAFIIGKLVEEMGFVKGMLAIVLTWLMIIPVLVASYGAFYLWATYGG